MKTIGIKYKSKLEQIIKSIACYSVLAFVVLCTVGCDPPHDATSNYASKRIVNNFNANKQQHEYYLAKLREFNDENNIKEYNKFIENFYSKCQDFIYYIGQNSFNSEVAINKHNEIKTLSNEFVQAYQSILDRRIELLPETLMSKFDIPPALEFETTYSYW